MARDTSDSGKIALLRSISTHGTDFPVVLSFEAENSRSFKPIQKTGADIDVEVRVQA